MAIHALLAGVRRFQKESDERAAAKYFSAVIASSVAAFLFFLALCFADQVPQAPWPAYASAGLVVSDCVRQLWKAYFVAALCAREWQHKFHEVELRIASGNSGEP